jgi:predicted dehydrogenase
MSNEKVRVGVIGAGAVAQVAHLVALAKLNTAKVTAICDTDYARARALASRVGVRDVYEDTEEMLRHAQPDAVVVSTPNHLHEVHVISALSAGAHVLCERPLALTKEGIERIVTTRDRTGLVVLPGMNLRFRSDVQAALSFLEGGELGDLTAIRGGWYTFRPTGEELGWRVSRDQAGGGAMLDLGLPFLDLALWMAGYRNTLAVSAQLTPGRGMGDVEDAGCALLRCEGGLSIFVDASWRHAGDKEKAWFELMGTRGSAKMTPLRVFKEMHGVPVNVTPTGAQSRLNIYNASYRAQWAHFIAAIRGETKAPEIGDQLRLHHVMEGIWRSAEENREVTL